MKFPAAPRGGITQADRMPPFGNWYETRSDVIDVMGLSSYRKKRHFEHTREPKGPGIKKSLRRPNPTLSFVIQEHAARQLHYDFRLELDGVLRSWAVPKGPSTDTKVKRLAVQTEDHPLEYAKFEGTIPAGQYGAGKVVIWDHGTWTPESDPHEQYGKGHLTLTLQGERLHGRWHLIRRGEKIGEKSSWLLFKGHDELPVGRAPAKPRVKGCSVTLTHPERVIYPELGIHKRDVFAYYQNVAPYLLPHVSRRPLTVVRCPQGQGGPCFFQKHAQKGSSDAIHPIPIREEHGQGDYTYIDDVDGLLGLVQMSVLEVHTWGAHIDHVEHPDLLVLDLDPAPELDFSRVTSAARLLHDIFDRLDLQSFVKTTGGKGLHVCVPLLPKLSWDEMKGLTQSLADTLVRHAPREFLAVATKARRKGKIFVDYLRNSRGATFIAPYSTRARPQATVATPVEWSELDALRPEAFTMNEVVQRLRRPRGDPWRGMPEVRQGVTRALLRSVQGAVARAG